MLRWSIHIWFNMAQQDIGSYYHALRVFRNTMNIFDHIYNVFESLCLTVISDAPNMFWNIWTLPLHDKKKLS